MPRQTLSDVEWSPGVGTPAFQVSFLREYAGGLQWARPHDDDPVIIKRSTRLLSKF